MYIIYITYCYGKDVEKIKIKNTRINGGGYKYLEDSGGDRSVGTAWGPSAELPPSQCINTNIIYKVHLNTSAFNIYGRRGRKLILP